MTGRANYPSLRVFSVSTSKSSVYDCKCAAPKCGTPMRVGDVCIAFDAGPGVYVNRQTYFHRRCLLDFILATPMEKAHVASEIDRIRLDGSAVMALLGAD